MIYYLLFFVSGILIDFKDLKNTKKKTDIIFYIVCMILALGLAIFYYSNTNRIGIADYVIKIFKLGRM